MPRPLLVPTADHPITVEPNPRRVVVRLGGRTIADTRAALTLREGTYAPVHYIPREDVDMTLLKRAEHASWCPYKGEAGYFDIRALGEAGDNAVWTYEAPFQAVAGITGRLAFYPDRVSIIELP